MTAGVKYAANYWLHMFPYREPTGLTGLMAGPSARGCSNTGYADNWR